MSLITDKIGCFEADVFPDSFAIGAVGADGATALLVGFVDLDITKNVEGETS
jgi:hypothetical protein